MLDWRSLVWVPGRAHSAAKEDEGGEDCADPELESNAEVIRHSPSGIAWGSDRHRSAADVVVLGHKEDTGGDKDSELEQAGNECAVDGTDSPSVSPCSDEHKESVESNNAVGSTHKSSDERELRARLLAVHVTIFREVDLGLHEVIVVHGVSPAD